MFKKTQLLVLFGCLCFFVVNCSRVHHVPQKSLSDWDGKKIKILSLKKVSGEVIEFLEIECGYIENDKVVGLGKGSTKIDAENVVKEVYDYGELKSIITKDNKEYEVTYRDQNNDCYWIQDSEYRFLNIPLSEIREIVVLKRGRAVGKGVLGGVLIGGAIGGVIGLIEYGEGAEILPLAGGMIGLPVGLIVGIMINAEETYIFPTPDSLKIE